MPNENNKNKQQDIKEISEKRDAEVIKNKDSLYERSHNFSLQFKETDDEGPVTFTSDEKNK
ncbi:MAG: hypothetical protein ACK5MV_07550 [Aminipila sp.]